MHLKLWKDIVRVSRLQVLYTLVDESLDPQLQEELTKARLITILQSVPGIG